MVHLLSVIREFKTHINFMSGGESIESTAGVATAHTQVMLHFCCLHFISFMRPLALMVTLVVFLPPLAQAQTVLSC
jgi:hypothetical protein